jgi:hypothetical protein
MCWRRVVRWLLLLGKQCSATHPLGPPLCEIQRGGRKKGIEKKPCEIQRGGRKKGIEKNLCEIQRGGRKKDENCFFYLKES